MTENNNVYKMIKKKKDVEYITENIFSVLRYEILNAEESINADEKCSPTS